MIINDDYNDDEIFNLIYVYKIIVMIVFVLKMMRVLV